MVMGLIKKFMGTKGERDIKRVGPMVDRINVLDEELKSLSDEELKAKTPEFRNRLANGETVDDILCEAYAVVKNVCRRLLGTTWDVCGHDLTWDMVPFDVQLIGAIVLHQGKIAEMATGEGKTLVATMPLYLNALEGKGAHLVTVNDYLARRDSQWMGLLYEWLGLTCGCIQNQMDHSERKIQYGQDITYGTNSEFGFDYLRDNGMAYDAVAQVQRGYHYAIIDEIDSILIDEARTPLIISGPAPSSSHQYFELKPKVDGLVRKQRTLCNSLVKEARDHLDKDEVEAAQLIMYQVNQGMPKHKQLMHMFEDPATRKLHEQIQNAMLTDMRKEQARGLREDLYFTIDERGRDAGLTEKGCNELNPHDPDSYVLPDLVSAVAEMDGDPSLSEQEKAQRQLAMQDSFADRSERIHNVDQLIRAYCLYEKDVEYVIQNNQVVIVDEYTGRIMPGRRWSDGLHQAVEAKEGVKIERETQTLATITIQNYFRIYDKLAGMTGTAETEANEFRDIYSLDVIVIPTNRPIRRVDFNDVIYKTYREKYKAIIDEISERHKAGQPMLVGTVSVDSSELLSRMLKRAGIPHSVLNAKNHEREAEIVTRAGQPGAVTIATNMAGRGTDIKLGEGVVGIARDVITSQSSLRDKVDGETLEETIISQHRGLHVIGSGRHESRRIDRQLRGRCARQGDPGSSRFYISLEDDLMRLFGSDRIANIMSRLGLEEGQELEHKWLNRSIETAQRRVEQQNFSMRKRTLEYDDVMNKQREVIYGIRGDTVRGESIREQIYDILEELTLTRTEEILASGADNAVDELQEWVQVTFPVVIRKSEFKEKRSDAADLGAYIFSKVKRAYGLKVSLENPNSVEMMERQIVLHTIDTQWQDYLRAMDALRQGVGLRAYGQRDPLVEYKREAYEMFGQLMDGIQQDIATSVFRSSTSVESFDSFLSSLPQTMVHDEVSLLGGPVAAPAGAAPTGGQRPPQPMPGGSPFPDLPSAAATATREAPKVGRNDPCPCGSGKKYKKCCGSQ